jgi:hypothetical protein
MRFRQTVRTVCAVAIVGLALAAQAQPKPPSVAAMALAKELMDVKGGTKVFEPTYAGVITYHKNLILATNPNLGKDLNEITQKMFNELLPRRLELQQEIVKIYATHFTEQELKDALVFYKSPVGRKMIENEPLALEESMAAADKWASKFAEEVVIKLRAELKKKGHNVM